MRKGTFMSRFWQHFLHNGRRGPRPGYLGLQGYAIPLRQRLAARFGLEQATGVEVQTIDPHSPAEDAGILEGDVVLRLGDEPTPSADELNKLLSQIPADVPVPVLLLRGERCLERLVMVRTRRVATGH
jgi:S1-C subfamily serine protease